MSRRAVFSVLTAFVVVFATAALTEPRDYGQPAPSRTGPSQGLPGPKPLVPEIQAGSISGARELIDNFGRLPVYFMPNRGQLDARVSFYAQGRDKSVYFSSQGLTIALDLPSSAGVREQRERWSVKMDFLGARKDVRPEGLEESGGVVSFFKGKPAEWKTGLPTYSKIIYRDLWPGIDLVYKGERDLLKYEFTVDPGADPSRIKIAYRGATALALTEDGRLAVETPAGDFEDGVPVAYQEMDGARQTVPAAYALEVQESNSETHVVGFEVVDYDRNRTLILDPTVIIFCGYIGTPDCDAITGVAVDGSGNVYVVGQTWASSGFPVKAGPDLTFNGYADAFVAKLDESGTTFSYCGFIGGAGTEWVWDLAVDSAGNAYVAGATESGPATFPVKTGPVLTYSGANDGFVAKVNPEGTALVYCGYVGGSGTDRVNGIAVDGAGRACIAGYTCSSNLPVKTGPDLTFNGGSSDAMVGRINAAGTGFEYLGYIGGSNGSDIIDDNAGRIAVDADGNAYVVGDTCSSDLPVTGGPGLTFGGERDGFVAKVNAAGTGFVYLGYIGGNGYDGLSDIAVDAEGAACIAGVEDRGSTDGDALVAKIDPSGANFIYRRYIGGTAWERAYGIALDESGQAFVCGRTSSTESSFPVLDGPGLTYQGGLFGDAFVAGVSADGMSLIFCGYIGGSGSEEAAALALDPLGNLVVGGWTDSDAATFPVESGPSLTPGGGQDGFIAKIGAGLPGPTLTSLSPSGGFAGDPGFTLAVFGSVFVDGAVVRWDGRARPTTFVGGSEVRAAIEATELAAGKDVRITVKNPDGGISNALTFSISNPEPVLASLSATQVTGGGAGFVLTAFGSNFVPSSVVRWRGTDRATTYVGGTELQAAILTTDVALPGEALVTVFNPGPGGGASGSVAVNISSFVLSADPSTTTVTAGQSATYTITVTPQNGPFDASVAFACQGLPSKCTATFSPASATPGSSAVTTTLTLATKAPAASAAASLGPGPGFGPAGWGILLLALISAASALWRRSMRLASRWLAALALTIVIILVGGCGAGGGNDSQDNGTPKGTHVVSVQGTAGNILSSASVTLTVE